MSRQQKPSRPRRWTADPGRTCPSGYRMIASMMRADGHQVSTSTVQLGPPPSKSTCSATPTMLCDPAEPSNAHRVRLTSPFGHCDQQVALADPLVDWEVLR